MADPMLIFGSPFACEKKISMIFIFLLLFLLKNTIITSKENWGRRKMKIYQPQHISYSTHFDDNCLWIPSGDGREPMR